MSKITIVIPVYNVAERYLRECIESVLRQSLLDIEIILVDDGSTDQSGYICDRYEEEDSRVRTIHQPNQGAAAARNRGIAAATAKWIMFVDADDWLDERNCEEAFQKAEEGDLDILLWGSYKCYGDKKQDYRPYQEDIPLFSEERKAELQLKTMVGDLPLYQPPSAPFASGATCSKLYRRRFLTENGLEYDTGLKRAEDVNFNIRAYEKAKRIGYLNRQFYYYRQLEDSAVYRYRDGGVQLFTEALDKLLEFLEESQKPRIFYQVYYMRCIFFLLESTEVDYFHKDNQKPLSVRMAGLRRVCREEPYKRAVQELDLSLMTFPRRIPVYLLRLRMVYLFCLFFWLYQRSKKR